MKIAMLVEDVKNLKEKAGVNIPIDVANSNDHNSIVQEEDDASSNDLEKKKTMVKQERKTSDVKNKGKKAEVPVKKVKKEKAIVIPELNDKSISSGDWKNYLEWEKSDKCRQVMQGLASTLEKVKVTRKPHLTKTQLWPFVGNSTVKRIITGVTPSTVSYDPFAKVESQKLVKVMDFVKRDLEQEESGYGEFCAQFYLKIMVPRDAWPTDKYGWLSDSDKKKIEVSDMYIKAFNGEYPEQFVTGKKWYEDVDTLFLCHHVNGDHWVALRIDLQKFTIHVYDSIPSVVKEHDLKNITSNTFSTPRVRMIFINSASCFLVANQRVIISQIDSRR
ncbi:PREDICTED: uncharacterized protein LOC106302873 [Brassica oleracea var. oleracea]|uniref:uncharacterized protein LOC106302873 n=1 Tax=Brassica oleracea var. oleracea TaxID=109376 RepID=UPI0006A74FC9|nr:PREDICTED: uncharacterized protein LOC106302873 [Brassica oleracea var. oleracea]